MSGVLNNGLTGRRWPPSWLPPALFSRSAPPNVLTISADDSLSKTRALLLSGAGLEISTAIDLPSAVQSATYYEPEIVIICHCFTKGTQSSYFERLDESVPGMHFVYLTEGVSPEGLIAACQNIEDTEGSSGRLVLLRPNEADVALIA